MAVDPSDLTRLSHSFVNTANEALTFFDQFEELAKAANLYTHPEVLDMEHILLFRRQLTQHNGRWRSMRATLIGTVQDTALLTHLWAAHDLVILPAQEWHLTRTAALRLAGIAAPDSSPGDIPPQELHFEFDSTPRPVPPAPSVAAQIFAALVVIAAAYGAFQFLCILAQ